MRRRRGREYVAAEFTTCSNLTPYGSNILTLRPGEVIGTGTPAGVGSARTPRSTSRTVTDPCARTLM